VIIVYDVTNEKSFENVSDLWLKDINAHADKENVQKILVANKCDMTRYSSVKTSNTGKLVSATTVFIYE
jgi:GTPase SAR1 family protein